MSAKSGPISTPAAMVASISARRGHKGRRSRGLLRRRRKDPLAELRSTIDGWAGSVRKRIPSGRRRRRLLRDAHDRLDRLAGLASNVGALLGVAAAGAELLSAVRGRTSDGDGSGQRAGTRSAREHSRLKQRHATEDVDDETTGVSDGTTGVGEDRTELTDEDDTVEDTAEEVTGDDDTIDDDTIDDDTVEDTAEEVTGDDDTVDDDTVDDELTDATEEVLEDAR
jgi:hypothetical protein